MNEFLMSHPEGCQHCQRCQAAQTVIEALVRDTLRQTLDALVPVLAYEITQQLR